jgi:antitoxin (DNA-binding transcriptional repressor) of toxin-antitoxin stability system
VAVFAAKTRLSELIDSGDLVAITKHGYGRQVATLSPIRQNPADELVTSGIAVIEPRRTSAR